MLAANLLKQCTSFTSLGVRTLYTCPVLEAARKGTRMRKEALKKVRKRALLAEQKKPSPLPRWKQMELKKVGKLSPRQDDNDKDYPIDNVYPMEKYKWSRYTVTEAVGLIAEVMHPSQYNNPNARVMAHVELSMSADKKNQYIRDVSNVMLFPHHFEVPHYRTTVAICTDEEMVVQLNELGVTFSVDLKQAFKMIKKGELELKKYNHVICHSSLLPELIDLRAYLGKRFPSPREGTASHDIVSLARKFVKGIEFTSQKDKYDLDFAKIETPIGTVDMTPEQLEENLKELLKNIEECRPRTRSKDLITLVSLYSPEFSEQFILAHQKYVPVKQDDEEPEHVESAENL